jgi:hypothetical protein
VFRAGQIDFWALGVQVHLHFRSSATMVHVTRDPLLFLARSVFSFPSSVRWADLVL